MKTSILACSFALLAAPLAFIQCSGSSTSPSGSNDNTGGMGSSSSSSSGGGGGSGSSSGGSGGGSVTDEGDGGGSIAQQSDAGGGSSGDGGSPSADSGGSTTPTIPVPEGGAPSDPGYVQCGGSPCSITTSHCCASFADGGTSSCVSPNTGCATGTYTQQCNEASDCNGGVCCQTIHGVDEPGETSCVTGSTCPASTTFQICRTDAECGGADAGLQRCIPQTCGSLEIEACAVAGTYDNPGPALYGCTATGTKAAMIQ